MNRFGAYLLILAALFMHLTVLNNIRVSGVEPDLILLCVIFFALFFGPRSGLETGLVAGALRDIFTFDIFGVNAFVLGMTGLAIGILNDRLLKESRMTRTMLIFSFTVFSMLAHYVILSAFSRYPSLGMADYLLSSVIPAAIYTTLVSIPLFSILTGIYKPKESDDLL